MDAHHRLQLAQRIHIGLMRELGQGIDPQQMLASVLYARDVLLVCEAYPDTELLCLAEQFRQASASPPAGDGGAAQHDAALDAAAKPRHPARRWLTPSTWFER